MACRKYFMLFSLILILAISGCEKKVPEEKAGEPVLRQEETPEGVPGPVIKETPKMIEAEKGIILEEDEILVSDFEGWPNNLGGEMGVYGALDPDWADISIVPYSWSYDPQTPGYNIENVHSGKQSFRLVNGLGLKPEETWGSFAMDLGPTIDLTTVPKKVESLDVSKYKYLTFWVKGKKGGEKMELLLRDTHALNYNPQVEYKLPDLTNEWQKITVPLVKLSGMIDLTRLDNIGIEFGRDVGNMEGDIAYIDDFVFTNKP